MKIVVAPDKFKGRLTALQAARAIERGMRSVWDDADVTIVPMADGGEGTVDAFLQNGARRCTARVRGPLGDPVEAAFAMRGDTAIIEAAGACGSALIERDRRDPMHADTFGVGELLQYAVEAGARRVVIGLGGSATNDGGTGMLRALGVRFSDEGGALLDRDIARYERLQRIDASGLDSRLREVAIAIACDVDNPLCGSHGASATYGPQKGATSEQIALLDRVLDRIAAVAASELDRDEREAPGAGAAGGLGYALLEFLGARMQRGARLVAEELGLDRALAGAALCATGEGKIDEQTLHGKVVDGVAALACARGVPVVAFAGAVEEETRRALEARGVAVREADASVLEEAARAYAVEFERS